MKTSQWLTLFLFLFAYPLLARAQTPIGTPDYDLRANYTKREVMIPMRDGARLMTAIYAPKQTGGAQPRTYPVMLNRTPYSITPYGADAYPNSLGPSELFARAGYVFVYQDVRGRFMSEGDFVHVRPVAAAGDKAGTNTKTIDESTDTYDTIEWLMRNVPDNNGRVGMWGISYPGFYASMGLIGAHPALRAASPQAPVANWFIGDDWHHNGTLFLAHAYTWLANNDRPRPKPTAQLPERLRYPTPDGYQFFLDAGPISSINEKYFKGDRPFWNEILSHPTYDEFWKARDIRPHLKGVRPAVLTVGGWFDSENLYGALYTYRAIEEQNPGATNVLVMGPWEHGHWAGTEGDALGALSFGARTARFYREQIELPFFNKYLKDENTGVAAEAHVFVTGENAWRQFAAWPPRPAAERSLYFRADGALSFDAPTNVDDRYDEYVSDPARPVPHLPGVFPGMKRGYMTEDQRFASRRTDVLTYQTAPLDAPLTVCGEIKPTLFVSTSGTDSDFVVKLIDVFPDDAPDQGGERVGGYQMLIRGEPFRAKFRNGLAQPEAMVPGKVEKISFTMPDACHTFGRGHRVMAQVQSSWFPLVDRNPQTMTDIYRATAKDFVRATERLHRSKQFDSHVKLNVVP